MDDYFAGSRPRTAPSTYPQPPYAQPPYAQPPYPQAPAYPQQPGPQGFAPAPGTPPASAYPGWAPPPGSVPAPQPAWGATPYTGATQQKSRNWPMIVLVVAGSLVALLVLLAVAIPVFLNQREAALASRTSVSVPSSVAGLPLATTPAAKQAEAGLVSMMPTSLGLTMAGLYTNGMSSVVVLAGAHRMTRTMQAGFLAGVESDARADGARMHDVAPGPLGGTMRCYAQPKQELTECAFTDAGSYGVVAVVGLTVDHEVTARAAREAFVHRR